jgi:hypothetical protein
MNDDLKNDLDKLAQELGPYASNTNTILRAINDLSKKMDDTQKESEKKEKFRFSLTITISVLSFLAGAVAAVAGVLALIA